LSQSKFIGSTISAMIFRNHKFRSDRKQVTHEIPEIYTKHGLEELWFCCAFYDTGSV
jgi:hypothetical protein